MSIDVLKWPLLGRLLKFRQARTFFQVPVFLVSVAMIFHGLVGPSFSPQNLATTLTWVHFRGELVLVLLCAGNFFCMACPFVLVRDLARKLRAPRWNWPMALRNKWLAVALFAGVLFVYEAFSLWSSPWRTAWLIIGYFLAIVIVDTTFKHAVFCKFICPIGQFNFLSATLSPLEVQVRSNVVCDECNTKDCIRGTRSADELVTVQRGCELALFLPEKVGNMDCTFCLDCVHACPHDNIGLVNRVPGDELQIDPQRSGVGHLLRRADLGALATVFSFGALMNAFGMVSPLYSLERWLSQALRITNHTAVLGSAFIVVIVLEPTILLSAAAMISKKLAGLAQPWVQLLVRYSFSLTPVGFGMWLAHYSFHLLTGLYSVVPLVQSVTLSILRHALLGTPDWSLIGLPARIVQPFEYGFILLGLLGSLSLSHHYAHEDCPGRWFRVFIPWAIVAALLSSAGIWLMAQPMEMRATFLE